MDIHFEFLDPSFTSLKSLCQSQILERKDIRSGGGDFSPSPKKTKEQGGPKKSIRAKKIKK